MTDQHQALQGESYSLKFSEVMLYGDSQTMVERVIVAEKQRKCYRYVRENVAEAEVVLPPPQIHLAVQAEALQVLHRTSRT